MARDTKAFWAGYIDVDISQKMDEIRQEKGWTKTKTMEEAFKLLVKEVLGEETLQKNGIQSDPEPDLPEHLTWAQTKTGRPAIRTKEEWEL